MDLVWGRFQVAYPRKTCTVMDDDAGKLRQPLMASGGEEDSGDEEMGGLLPHGDLRPLVGEGAAARRKRRRRKDDEDLGEVVRGLAVSVEPLQLLRKWVTSLSVTGKLLTPPRSPKRSHRRRLENMDEVSDRALALLAVITIGFCLLLLLVVYTQAA